jgi:hypothetical protein
MERTFMRLLRPAATVVLITILAAGAAFAQRVPNARFTLTLQSDTGEILGNGKTYRFTQADTPDLSVRIFQFNSGAAEPLPAPNYVEIFSGITRGGTDFGLTLGSDKLGKALTAGVYPVATRAPFALPNTAGLDFFLDFTGCNTETGRFTISAITFDCTENSSGTNVVHLKQLVVAFEDHCEGERPALRGQLSYLDTSGIKCGSTDSGGDGGDGGTPTPTPTTTGPLIVLSDDTLNTPIVMNNSSTATVLFSTFADSASKNDITLTATSDSEDLIATLNKSVIAAPGIGDVVLTLRTTSKASAGDHVVTITATDGTTVSSASVFVTVLCDPPFILGIDQPKGSTVSAGRPAQLSVKASGSGPFTYQWFTGASGLVNFPLAGGTSANFTTSALNDTTSYWVRVSNPCGSVDSQTATVNVSASAKPTRQR